jgi:hypothetical protein
MKRPILVVLGLLAFGGARLQFEAALSAEQKAARLRGGDLDLSMREKLGQMGFVAALSGFRAIVADGFWIHAETAWERTDWARMKIDLDMATSLQPRCVLFWDMASWHMSHNASVNTLDNEKLREAVRIKMAREYYEIGKEYLLTGIANNPDSPKLYESLAMLYTQKYNDHCKAAEAYAKCASLPRAPMYARRFAVYELAKCPGHEREAYEKMVELYKMGEQERLPTLLKWLDMLAEKLGVPPAERVYTPPPPPAAP